MRPAFVEMPVNAPAAAKEVLVVDDELEMRLFIANLLRTNGFEAIGSEDAGQAFRLARRRHPALIIMDAMMSHGDGVALYGRIKQDAKTRGIPVLMLSTLDRRTFFLACKRRLKVTDAPLPEPDAYVRKPPEGEELLGLVYRLIHRRRNRGPGGSA